jgi:hypothetical protein
MLGVESNVAGERSAFGHSNFLAANYILKPPHAAVRKNIAKPSSKTI